MINWNWKPLISVGPLKFGQPAIPLIKKYNLIALESDCESSDWDTYEFPNSQTRIYVENSYIDSVGCYDNLIYEGTNLLGLSLNEIRSILGNENEIGEVIEMQTPIEYETLGLQLWLEDKITIGGICYRVIED
jgi:hypothetical protein